MLITLSTVRSVLRHVFGRESFIGSLIKSVSEDGYIPTVCIAADGALRFNPAFVTKHVTSQHDLVCLILHELMHPMFGHFVNAPGELENIAGDMVINAAISLLFSGASGDGSLFTKLYRPEGIEGLLRPDSKMFQSRYVNLYNAFYSMSVSRDAKLSTGEVIHALKVLTPTHEVPALLLLGTHGSQHASSSKSGLSQDALAQIAEDLRRMAQLEANHMPGFGENLFELFMETIRTHLSLKKALLERFTSRQKVDNFLQSYQTPRISMTPIPLRPSKRDLVLLAAGLTPFHYHNRVQGITMKKQGLAIYLDVSGSVNTHLPQIIGLLKGLERQLTSIFLFSNAVVEVPFSSLLQGWVRSTYGTDFDCIARSIVEKGYEKAVIITDGYAGLSERGTQKLIEQRVKTLTILFGGKTDCEEFQRFGSVVQLADVTA